MPTLGVILFALCFAQSRAFAMAGIYTCVLFGVVYKKGTIRFNLLDGLVLALWVWEFIIGMFTEGQNNCISYLTGQYLFITYYFILRLGLRDVSTVKPFMRILLVFIFMISVISLVSFGLFAGLVYDAGFESLYDFKYLYRPFGSLNNVWGTLMLMLLGIAAIPLLTYAQKGKEVIFGIIPFCLLLVCLVCSFSRGIYICLALSMLLISYYILTSNDKTHIKLIKLISLAVVLIGMVFVFKNDALRTMRLVETESQQRSLQARVNALDYTWQALKNNPWMGCGTGNYSLAVNEYTFEHNGDSFTNMAPNVFSQLLLEKGVVGTVLWGLVFLIECIMLSKCSFVNRRGQVFLFLFLLVIFAREMSFAAILTDKRLLAALAIWLALSQCNISKEENGGVAFPKTVCMIMIIIGFSGLSVYHFIFWHDQKCYQDYSIFASEKDYVSAYEKVNQARDNVASNVLASSACMAIYNEHQDGRYLSLAQKHIDRAVTFSPNDAYLLGCRAVVQYRNKKEKALGEAKSLVAKFPENTFYRLLLADMLYGVAKRKECIPHFTKAVIASPSILESKSWKEFVGNDRIVADDIMYAIKLETEIKPDDPLRLSRYGKLLYLLGDSTVAKEYLSEAAAMLPNLKTPWVYLAKIAGANASPELLRHLAIWNDTSSSEDNNDYSNYNVKSMHWYLYPLHRSIGFRICCPQSSGKVVFEGKDTDIKSIYYDRT